MRRLKLDEKAVLSRSVQGEVVVMDLRTSTYLAVSSVGAVMWPLLESGCTEDELVGEVLSRYEVDEGRVRDDVRAFVDDLLGRHLVVEVANNAHGDAR